MPQTIGSAFMTHSAAAILVYHRLTDETTDPLGLAVSPSNLDEQLAVIGDHFHSASLHALTQMLKGRQIRDRSVVVTFDDGYDSVLHAGKPLLERHEISATVFVPSGFLGSPREFWWEELDRILLHARREPTTFAASADHGLFRWHSARPHFRLSRPRTSLRLRRMDARTRLYYDLFAFLKRAPREQRAAILDRLAVETDAPGEPRRGRRPLTPEELHSLADSELVTIGGHTISHPVLSDLPSGEQLWEIDTGASMLEQVIDRSVTSFAYPYGGRSEINEMSVAAARTAGFTQAVANVPGLVRAGANLHRLPRFVVSNWNGDDFERRLDGWFRSRWRGLR